MRLRFTKNELEDAKLLAEELSTYGHPEPLCERAATLIMKMVKELEKENYEQV